MSRILIVLQARIGSTRLPGKLVLPLRGRPMLAHVLDRLLLPRESSGLVVATTPGTVPHIDGLLAEYERGGRVHRVIGSEEDVLSRFAEAVRRYDIDRVIRATADNPLVCVEYVDRAVHLLEEEDADLACYPRLPYGTGVEVVAGPVILEVAGRTSDPFEREHITQHLYRHEDRFAVVRGIPDPPLDRPGIRLTVDTREDYERMCRIYDALYAGGPIGLREALAFLDGEG